MQLRKKELHVYNFEALRKILKFSIPEKIHKKI